MALKKAQLCFLCGCFIFLLLKSTMGRSLEEVELSLNHKQRVKLNQLKELVENRVPHPYMSEDWQLIKWLRVNKFDVAASERMIMQNVKWREENKMDTILEEDWSDFDGPEYKVSLEGCKDGRPVISFDMGDWPLRNLILAGKKARFLRYTDKIAEEGAVLIRELQKTGHNITQLVDLYDFTNFNSVNHMCIQCLSVYVYIAQIYENNYPLLSHKSIMANVPSAFMTIYNIVLGIASDEKKAALTLYGRDKRDWKESLRKEFGPNNLSKQFGGNKEEVWDVTDVLKDPTLFKCHNKTQLHAYTH